MILINIVLIEKNEYHPSLVSSCINSCYCVMCLKCTYCARHVCRIYHIQLTVKSSMSSKIHIDFSYSSVIVTGFKTILVLVIFIVK